MPLNNQLLTNNVSLQSVLDTLQDTIRYNLNCVKVASVVSFNQDTLTACCKVNNKRLVQLKNDGNQVLRDYPLIYARVHFLGWGEIGATFPINQGMEGILLFNDRELETWFLTGEAGNLAYDRCHDLTDAIFICGVHSMPNIPLVDYLATCINIYYEASNIQTSCSDVTINTVNTNINSSGGVIIDSPDVTVTGNLNVGTGVSAVVPTGSITLTFSNGILTGVS